MVWEEKQEQFEKLWRSNRHAKNLYRYIPRRLAGAICWAEVDEDGYWIYLNNEDGHFRAYDGAEDCGTIHEYTIADLIAAIKTIRQY